MRRERLCLVVGLGAALSSLSACVPDLPPPRLSEPPTAPVPSLTDLYNASIARAAVASPAEALPLLPLKPDADGTYTLVTWSTCRGASEPGRCGSYEVGKEVKLEWKVWVTGGNEVRDKCRTFHSNVALRLQQLFGLPPYTTDPPPEKEVRQFVILNHVPANSVIRPCPDTRVETTQCSGTTFPDTPPPNMPPDYFAWFAKNVVSSWQLPAAGKPPSGFPWTRQGYTYDWAPEAKSRYGVSEYVIYASKEAPVTAKVRSVATTEAFCAPQQNR